MANNTHVSLDKVTVGTATSSITFTSISGTYTDLVIVPVFTPSSEGMDLYLTFNGDTTSGLYSKTHMAGYGTSSVGSTRFTGQNRIASYWQAGPGNAQPTQLNYSIMNYSNSTTFKTILGRAGSFQTSAHEANAFVGLWRNTNAITSITLSASTGNFAVGSTFELYGILAESISPTVKATGGTVYSDSTYYYHVFGESGTFTPTQSITADVLVIAGGGGGGGYTFISSGGSGGAGGGAGGLLGFNSQSLTATNYTVTVGSGGNGGNGATGTTGSDSQFASLTLVKGGGGGGGNAQSGQITLGLTGGSGGGTVGWNTGPNGNGGAATTGQGNAGGGLITGASRGGGGGGGAGAAGTTRDMSAGTGGQGGVGSSSYSSWGLATGVGEYFNGTYYFAGGGAGNGGGDRFISGGYGGGGSHRYDVTPAEAGRPNTGGGGAGGLVDSSATSVGGKGGSGVVIVRYAK
jgi:hypothetical protein